MVTRTPAGISAEQWKEITKDLDPSSSTVNDYRKVLNLLHSAGPDQYQILTMTTEDAANYFRHLDERVRSGDLSENTAHRYKATLRSLGKRIESSPSVSAGYSNPFKGLVKNEQRLRTSYRPEMFASPESIILIRETLDKLSTRDHLMIEFIFSLGLTPGQIRSIRVCDFQKKEDGLLRLAVNEGTILEYTKKDRYSSDLYLSGAPVTFVRSSSRSITWNYTGTYIMPEKYSDILYSHIPTLGQNRDSRKFFLTSRHLEYSYRALHHLVHEVCDLAGLSEALTPNQLSLSGIIMSYLMQQELPENAAEGWIVFPLPLERKIDTIREQLSPEFIDSFRKAI